MWWRTALWWAALLINLLLLAGLLYFALTGTGEYTQTVDVNGRRQSTFVVSLPRAALLASSVPALTVAALLSLGAGGRGRADASIFA